MAIYLNGISKSEIFCTSNFSIFVIDLFFWHELKEFFLLIFILILSFLKFGKETFVTLLYIC